MEAWNYDANNIELDDINIGELSNHMVETDEIREFFQNSSRKMFVVAPKGTGKTYVLKVKSQKFRNENAAKGYKFIPKRMLCEQFVSNSETLSKDDLSKFKSLDIWKQLWELCVYTLIIKEAGAGAEVIPPEISEVIGEHVSSMGDLLENFMQVRHKIHQLHEFISKSLRPVVRDLSNYAPITQLAIFVDNIDEVVDKYVGYQAMLQGNLLSKEVWMNSQIGLMLVAREVHRINNDIKFFLTIRSEAYDNYHSPDKIKINGDCLQLNYSKQQTEEIFKKNINLVSDDKLVNPASSDPFVAFLGINQIEHKYVKESNGDNKTEPIFDFIYRHSFGRPRDIMVIGKYLNSIPRANRNSNSIGEAVSNSSRYLLNMLKEEIIPFFSNKLHHAFINSARNNILDSVVSKNINESLALKFAADPDLLPDEKLMAADIFDFYYSIGLIGVTTESKVNGVIQIVQTFARIGCYSLDFKNPKISSDYFVLHPSLGSEMKQRWGVSYYDTNNIVGSECLLDVRKIKEKEYHVHFGIDRDSISVVIPEISISKTLAIVVSTDVQGWHDIEKSVSFKLFWKSKQWSQHFRVLNEEFLSKAEQTEIINGWKHGNWNIIVYTKNTYTITDLLNNAHAISTTDFVTYKKLIENSLSATLLKQPHFYLCYRQFDESVFDDSKRILLNQCAKLTVEPVIIDRFCYSVNKYFDHEEAVMKIDFDAEEYCKIICFDKNNAALKKSSIVTRVPTDRSEQFEYYIKRQNYLVESLYSFYKYLFLNKHSNKQNYSQLISEFIGIQVARILHGLGDDNIRMYFSGQSKTDIESDLKKFAMSSLSRIEQLFEKTSHEFTAYIVPERKRQQLYPSSEEFFDIIKTRNELYSNPYLYLELMEYLGIKPLKKFKEVFISYSTLDEDFPEKIYITMRLLGLKVIKYSSENKQGTINSFMLQSIRDCVSCLIVSKNYLTSEPCKFELNTAIKEGKRNFDMKKYFSIDIDNFIFDIDFDTLPVYDVVVKENIEILKKSNINNFIGLYEDFNFKSVFERLSKIRNEFL